MTILLIAIVIWLIVLTIRHSQLKQTIRNMQRYLDERHQQESRAASPSATQAGQSSAKRQPHVEERFPVEGQSRVAGQHSPEAADTHVAGQTSAEPAATSHPSSPTSASPQPDAWLAFSTVTPNTLAGAEAESAQATAATQPTLSAVKIEPTQATATTEPRKAAAPLWPRVREVLIATGLWPDTSKGSLEAQFTTFIATRLGIILGIAALVFLAVHLGRNTPAWVRFIELLLVPAALCFTARLLRNRAPAFARVVLAGSMTMFYFTSFAAYAIPGVRIIEQAWLGFVAQIATLLVIGTFASKRNDQPLAVLTQALGFIACAFAFYHGLTTYLLSGCFLLGAGGALLYASRQWRACLWLGMAGTYGFFLLLVPDTQRIGIAANWVQWLYPLLAYLIFFASERLTAIRLQTLHERTSVIHHSANTGLALLTGFFAFAPQHLEYFYLGAALVAGACAIAFRQKPVSSRLAHQFTLKASILLSLFLLEILDGNLRCIALLLQALALLEGARRYPSKATLAAAIVAWLFSIGALFPALFDSYGLWQVNTLWTSLYLLGSSAMLLLAGRVLPRLTRASCNKALQMSGGALLGICAIAVSSSQFETDTKHVAASLINTLLLLAPVLSAFALAAKHVRQEVGAPNPLLGVALASAIALLWTHCTAIFSLLGGYPPIPDALQYWVGGIVVLSVLLVLGAGFTASRNARRVQHALLILTSYTLYMLGNAVLAPDNLLLVMALTGWLLVLLCRLPRYCHLTYIRLIPFGLAALHLVDSSLLASHVPAMVIVWAALALAFGWQLAQPYWQSLNGGFTRSGVLAIQWIQAVLLTFATLIAVFLLEDLFTRLALLGIFAAIALCIQRKRQPLLWLMQSLVWLAIAQLVCIHMVFTNAAGFTTLYLVQITLSALSLCVAQNIVRHLSDDAAKFIVPVQTIAGLAALLPLLAIPTDMLAQRTWLSLWYALPPFALVITGLALPARPYRLIGLIALLLPLARLFAYDILDTVHRIIAFGLLAVVLLITGYTYNRLLEGGRRKGSPKPDVGHPPAM